MRAVTGVLFLTLIFSGCTSARLRQSTVNQAGTVNELQYQQILNNLALLNKNEWAIPSQVLLKDGSAQIADLNSGQIGLEIHHAVKSLPQFLSARTVVEQWSMTPVTNDNALKLLQLAYRRAIGKPETLQNDYDFANDLAHELKKQTQDSDDFKGQVQQIYKEFKDAHTNEILTENCIPSVKQVVEAYYPPKTFNPKYYREDVPYEEYLELSLSAVDEQMIQPEETIAKMETSGDPEWAIRPEHPIWFVTPFAMEVRRQVKDVEKDLCGIKSGWYHVGVKHDVPKNALYVGQYKDCYVWVCSDGMKELSDFTLKIIKISSLIKEGNLFSIPGPRYTPSSSFPSL